MGAGFGLSKNSTVIFRVFSVFLCLGMLTGCVSPNQGVTATSQPATQATLPGTGPATHQIEPTITHGPQTTGVGASSETPETTGAATQSPDVNMAPHYTLDAEFSYFQHTVSVTETIRYMNNSPDPLVDLALVVEPNRWPGSFNLLSLSFENGEIVDRYELQDDRMVITLPEQLEPAALLELNIKFTLDLPQIPPPSALYRPQPFGYTSRQANIVDWYPYIPPYQPGEGWLVHPNWGFGEHLVFDKADFEIRLTLAEPVENLVIAASAPAERDGATYTYYLESARTFAISASDQYEVQTTNVGDVTIYSYSFPWDKYAGLEVLHNTAEALQLFSELILPYPHATLSVVEADFLDGMEYEGLFFLSHGFYNLYDGTPKGYLTFIAAHETAHQWWYGLVGNDQALEPWLDEALCTYMEHIFYENVYAEYPTGTGQSLIDWWWYYRVNYYEPQGWIDGAIYNFQLFLPYRDSVYLRGAQFLDDLRNQVGDPTFFTFLRDYATSNKDKIATGSDFFTILHENSNADLGSIVEQYFQTIR